MKPTLLIVGGAGYIGSHMVKRLAREDCRVLVLDDLSSGHKGATGNAELIIGDSGDAALLDSIFSAQHIDAVMNFASFIHPRNTSAVGFARHPPVVFILRGGDPRGAE